MLTSLPPMAAQNDAEAHDTAALGPPLPEPIVCGLDHIDPLQVETPALLSTATQKDDDAHDTDWNGLVSTVADFVHAEPLYVKALPPLSTAAQKFVVGHDTETRLSCVPTATGVDQEAPL